MHCYKARQHAVKGMVMELNFVRELSVPLRSNVGSTKKTTGWEDGDGSDGGGAERRRVGKQCCCGMSVCCSSLSQTSRVRAACPISYRQNALKMPQATRVVIIERLARMGWRERRRGEIEAR